jgi:hypothetical protein
MEFSFPAWSPWYQKDIDMLENVQKRAVNMVNGLGDLTYEQKLHKLDLGPLADRRAYADLVLMYKMLHGISSVKKTLGCTCLSATNF